MINDAVNVLNETRAPVCVKDVCNVTLYDFNNTYQTSAVKNTNVRKI